MSTKTLRKRIALVAVSAMGFGLLTSAGANAAASLIGESGSVGLVGPFAGSADLSQTATVLNTGKIILTEGTATIVSSGAAVTGGTSVNGSQTCATANAEIVPTGAVGTTFTIQVYTSGTCSAPVDLKKSAVVTIASVNNAGSASASNSSVSWTGSTADSGDGIKTTDVSGKSSTTRNLVLKAHVRLRDVYNAPIDNTAKGTIIAEVSSGAVVNIVATGGSAKGSYTTAATAANNSDNGVDANGDVWVTVAEAKAGSGWSGTLKVSYNGVLLATKSGTITGDVSKLTLAAAKVASSTSGKTTDNYRTLKYQAYDAAGNVVRILGDKVKLNSSSNPSVVKDINFDSTPADGVADGDYTKDAADGSTTQDVDNVASTATPGRLSVDCGIAGTSDVSAYFVNEAGAVIKSEPVKVSCAGDAASYTASFDKASYTQGEIATLTVSFKDSKGNAANSFAAVSDATTEDITISAPMLKQVEADAKSKKLDANGNVVYTFTVGTDSGITAGAYNAIVSFPTIDAPATVKYTVTTGGTAISNAEVLAAIVKLIASINKQITALQKLLTKKK